jgi:hypothetical protein
MCKALSALIAATAQPTPFAVPFMRASTALLIGGTVIALAYSNG